MIAIKSELKVLLDRSDKSLKDYRVEVRNDKLLVYDDEGKLFEYFPNNSERQRVQEALFHEKQTIIEGCLFGVDINANSVTICQLRLWIELLKNAYYRADGNLETLPNIDINIKCGNSLISRFGLDSDLRQALKKSNQTIESYRNAVQTYRNAVSKEQKREMERLINDIKGSFTMTLQGIDPNKTKLRNLEGELYQLENQVLLFEESAKEKKAREKKINKLNNEIDKLRAEIEDIESGKIYENALEWRFEFPEILNNQGDFIGFDVVIGNPPYISNKEMHKKNMQTEIDFINQNYTSVKSGNFDIYIPFLEKGLSILKINAELTYILPNKFIIAKYSKELLNQIFKQYNFINFTDLSIFNVFGEASVYPIIIRLSTQKIEQEITLKITPKLTENNSLNIQLTEKWNYINHSLATNLDSVHGRITNKIEKIEVINHEFEYSPGINGFQFANYGKCIEEYSDKSSSNSKRLVVTGIIDRYLILSSKTKYRGKNYDLPHIYYDREIISEGKWNLFCTPKIVVAGMTKGIEATLDEHGNLAPGVSVYSIISSLNNLKYALGILNSKLTNWYFGIRFQDKHLAGGYISINTKLLEKIPIIQASEISKKAIALLVDQILTAKKSDPKADTTALEKAINQLVYQLYGLTEEEIKIVEGGK
jgi:hypothetical protein